MSEETYAVVEVTHGEYHQGFKSREEANEYVFQRLDPISIKDDVEYEFRVVLVCDEYSSEEWKQNVNY